MLLAFMLFWLALPAMVFLVPGPLRKWLAAVPSLAVLLAAFTCSHMISSGERLLVAFPAMLFALKAGLLLGRYSAERCRECTGGFLIYLSVWPGFDAEPFTKRAPGMTLDAGRFIRGYVLMLAGLVGGTALAYWWHGIPAAARGVLALATIMMTVHLGYCDVLSSLMRWAGYPVTPLFDKPWCSSSLRDFWNKRWNLAFVEMNRQVFLPLLRRSVSVRAAVFIAFLLSGLLHEFAISYPAGAGFGGPLLYFLIQGVACMVESRLVGGTTSGVRRIWTWTVLLLPAPLLFTPSFLQAVVEPLFSEVHQIGASVGATQLLDKSLWFAAAGNLLTMAAGIQVPKRLNWKEELSKLTPFNRKVFLNYYAFTGGVIGAWALLTLGMHYELLAGNRVAGLVALVIALFWGARVAVDTFYFKHDDWPPGSELVVGHALLTTLFVCLTCVYAFFAVWCLWLSH